MKSNFIFFMKVITYSYTVGLIILLIELLTPAALMFSLPGYFLWMLESFIPLAGFLGVIPFTEVGLILFGADLPDISKLVAYYLILFPDILAQYKVFKKLNLAVKDNNWNAKIFRVVSLHHFWVCVFILFWFYLDLGTWGYNYPNLLRAIWGIGLNIAIGMTIFTATWYPKWFMPDKSKTGDD